MGGRRITAQQRKLYMQSRQTGSNQTLSSASAGISERSGRTIERDPSWTPAGQYAPRSYRTRADPFAAVWESEIVPMLSAAPGLQAVTILRELQERHPQLYPDKHIRTLQRAIGKCRAIDGPKRDVTFPQTVQPGWQMLFDFTHMDKLQITIGGHLLSHMLAHVRLRYSGWAFVEVVLGGESIPAVRSAIVHALEYFGGVPETIRTDSLSAAYKNI